MASGPAPRKGIGCAMAIAIAFGGIALLALVTCGGAAYWAISPGSQRQTALLVGEESLGYVEVSDLASSQPVMQLLQSVFEELERRDPENEAAPEWLRNLQGGSRDYQSMLEYVMPNSLMLTFEPAEGGLAWMTAVNFSGFTRPAKLLLARVAAGEEGSGPAASALSHGDATIYEFPQGASVGFLEGTFVAAAAADSARKAMDRLRETEPRRAQLLQVETPRSGSWDARGVLSGPAVSRLGIAPEQAKLARLGLRMEDADTASGYLVVDCPGEAEAVGLEQALRERFAEAAAGLSEQGLEVDFEVVRKASAVDVDLKLAGVRDYLLSKLEPAAEAGGEMPEGELAPEEEVPYDEEEPLEEEPPQEEELPPAGADVSLG